MPRLDLSLYSHLRVVGNVVGTHDNSNNNNNINNDNQRISRAPFHVKHAHLR